MEKITFKIGNHVLTGVIIYPSTKKIRTLNPGVLFVHGWESSQMNYIPRAEAISKYGAICMTFNLRGHGNSDGKLEEFSRRDHLNDVMAAYDYFISLPNVDKNKIGVVGASYGGYLSAILTSKRKVKWLLLRAPALYKDEDFSVPTVLVRRDMKDILIYRQSRIDSEKNYALKALTQYKNNVVLIECENDDIVPPQTIKNYKEALKNNKNYSYILLPKADHQLSREEYKRAFIRVLIKAFTHLSKR